jgi:hypothetical protein
MNKQEQRIAIAEACGWTRTLIPHLRKDGTYSSCCTDEIIWCKWEHPIFRPVDDDPGHDPYHAMLCLPDYLNDLNAMHEAEKTLLISSFMWETYSEILAAISDCNEYEPFAATATQRAKALLKTLNLWKHE